MSDGEKPEQPTGGEREYPAWMYGVITIVVILALFLRCNVGPQRAL